MPRELSPVRDRTGEFCHIGQEGDVWFLAGGYGSSKISRVCEVPYGKHIFFPIINMVYYPKNNANISCAAVKRSAALNNDSLLSIELELDGKSLIDPSNTRMSSDQCFDLFGKIPRDLNPRVVYPAASDGYWVMLKPLSKGKHTLRFNAQYNRDKSAYSKMAQNIEYELIVK